MPALPQTRQPAKARILCHATPPRVFRSVHNQATHSLRSPSYKWLAEFHYENLEMEDARAIVAFINARFGAAENFTIFHPASSADGAGIPGGVCRLQGGGTQTITAVSGRVLTIDGWNDALLGNLFEPGDLIGGTNAKEAFEVETAVAAGSEVVAVTVTQLPRRPDLCLNSPVSYLEVPIYMKVAESLPQDWGPPVLRSFTIKMEEDDRAVG